MSEQDKTSIEKSGIFKLEELTTDEKAFLVLFRSADARKRKEALRELKKDNKYKGLISKASEIMHGDDQKGKSISVPLLVFTFFYSTSIYILLLSFYFWLWHNEESDED